jgi:hypothetical protein
MQNSQHAMAELMPSTDSAERQTKVGCIKPKCRTMAVVDDFYQCQMQRPDCGYMAPFGTCYLCMSPLRREYSRHHVQESVQMRDS